MVAESTCTQSRAGKPNLERRDQERQGSYAGVVTPMGLIVCTVATRGRGRSFVYRRVPSTAVRDFTAYRGLVHGARVGGADCDVFA